MSTQQKATVEEVREMAAKSRKRDQGHRDKLKPIRIPANARAIRDGDVIRLVLPAPVSANSYWRSRVVQAGRKPMAVTYLSAQAKAYKALVKKIGEHCEPFRGPVRLTARVFRARRAGDLGNCEKVAADALEGVAFVNDSQIVESHWYLDDDKNDPRIELEIVSLEKVPALLFSELAGAPASEM